MKNENNEDYLVCSLLDRDLNQSWESLKLRGQISSYYKLDSIDSDSSVPSSPTKKAPIVQENKKKQVHKYLYLFSLRAIFKISFFFFQVKWVDFEGFSELATVCGAN